MDFLPFLTYFYKFAVLSAFLSPHDKKQKVVGSNPIENAHELFIVGARESTEYTVLINLCQEGQEIPSFNVFVVCCSTVFIFCHPPFAILKWWT